MSASTAHEIGIRIILARKSPASALGLTIPPSLRARADEVIE